MSTILIVVILLLILGVPGGYYTHQNYGAVGPAMICVFLAFVFALLAALNVPGGPYINLGWLGVAMWFLSLLIRRA